jgi:hypothetical protein
VWTVPVLVFERLPAQSLSFTMKHSGQQVYELLSFHS